MALSTFEQVLEHVPLAHRYLQLGCGLDQSTAADVVQHVLLRLYRSGPELLTHPKWYFLRACRWRALEIHRERRNRDKAYAVVEKRRQQREILVALEDEDKPKFFDQATPKQRQVLELLVEDRSQEEISVILEIPSSTVRMRLHLLRKKFAG